MLKTKSDLFYFLCDQKYTLLHKAQEAEDLHNNEAAQELRSIAEHIAQTTRRILKEIVNEMEVSA